MECELSLFTTNNNRSNTTDVQELYSMVSSEGGKTVSKHCMIS